MREEGEGGRKETDMERERRGGDESNASQETVWDVVPYQSILATHCGLPARLPACKAKHVLYVGGDFDMGLKNQINLH